MTWETVPLGSVAELNPRATSVERNLTFLGMADLGEDGRTTDGTPIDRAELRSGYTPFADGDILFAKITPCFENGKIGQATIPTPHGYGSTEFHVARPAAARLDARYLHHFLRSPGVRATGEVRMTGSAGQRRVPLEFLRQLRVPLPPLPEQRRVAAILDEADALRRARSAQLNILNSSVDAAIEQLVRAAPGTIALESLISEPFRNGISPSRSGRFEGEVLTLSAITRGSFDPSARKRDTFATAHGRDKLVTAGLHLICRGNGNPDLVGVMAVATAGLEQVAFPDTMIATRPSSAITSAALTAAWRSDRVREQIHRGAHTTNGTFKINQQLLASIEVPVGTPDQQAQIGKLEHERAKAVADIHASTVHLDTLFASLQHRAFRGEL